MNLGVAQICLKGSFAADGNLSLCQLQESLKTIKASWSKVSESSASVAAQESIRILTQNTQLQRSGMAENIMVWDSSPSAPCSHN